MPEIAEVEIKRRYCEQYCLGKSIRKMHLSVPELLKGITIQQLGRIFDGTSFDRTYRRGKFLFLGVSEERWLLIHLGMTGNIQLIEKDEVEPRFTRFTIDFTDNTRMCYISMRKLGKLEFTENPVKYMNNMGFGPDAWKMDKQTFVHRIKKRKGKLKALFLNQGFIAGVGNLYADEILYQSGMHPNFSAAELSPEQRELLYDKTQYILGVAIDVETDFSRLPDAFLLSHRRKDNQCPKGHGELERIKAGGRTTYFCPICQKIK